MIQLYRESKDDVDRKKDFVHAQNELTKAFYLLSENIIKAFRFQNIDKDEALQEGVLICFERMHRFNPVLGKAFPFCTAIILNHYKQLYRSAKHHGELVMKYYKHLCNTNGDPYFQSWLAKKRNTISKKIFPNSDDD